jgi:hypothetical protein
MPRIRLAVAGAVATFVAAINDRGQIVGAARVAVPATNGLSLQPSLAR